MQKNISRHSPRLTIRRLGYLSRTRRKTVYSVVGILVVCLGMIAAQLIVGATGRVRPGVKLATVSVGGADKARLLEVLHNEYQATKINFVVKDTTLSESMSRIGVSLDTEAAVQTVLDYPVWQRFIPFSLFVQYGKQYEVALTTDDNRFAAFVTSTIAPLCDVTPVNARVHFVDDTLQLAEAKPGAHCSVDDVTAVVQSLSLGATDAVTATVSPRDVAPAVSTDEARQALSQAQAMIDQSLQITLLGKAHTPPKVEIASWLEFVSDEKTGKIAVSVSDDALESFLKVLQKSVYIAPGVTTVSMVDGVEKGRTLGAAGRGVDIKKGVQAITGQLEKGDGTVALTVVPIAPSVRYDRQYTKTEAGLRALVTELGKKGDVAISVREVGGRGWSANAHGDKQYTPASTYKLFVAYAVLKHIESGAMKWNDPATGGRTISECFDTMIIHSDNPCSIWFGEKIGWKKVTSMMHAAGVSSRSSLYTRGGFVATTNDETNFLVKLQQGTLLSSSSTKRLLDVMKRQIYRAGIPAGTGAVVADKVGFLEGLLHDAAIVSTPTGAYVLTIFTNNSSWGTIADISRQIHQHLKY